MLLLDLIYILSVSLFGFSKCSARFLVLHYAVIEVLEELNWRSLIKNVVFRVFAGRFRSGSLLDGLLGCQRCPLTANFDITLTLLGVVERKQRRIKQRILICLCLLVFVDSSRVAQF